MNRILMTNRLMVVPFDVVLKILSKMNLKISDLVFFLKTKLISNSGDETDDEYVLYV